MGVANGFNYEGVWDLSLSPKECKIASCHEDKNVWIWDLEEFKEDVVLEGHGNDVLSVDWDKKRALLVSGAKDRVIKFWDPLSKKNIGNLFNHTNTINAVKFNRN